MLSILVEGTLIGAPVRRTSAKGTTFVTTQLRCNADDGESVFCSVIAFQAAVAEALVALGAGDTVAVAGPAVLSQWEKNGEHKVGLKVTASRVMSVYDAGMRRRAASPEHQPATGLIGCARAPPSGDTSSSSCSAV
jgi:single-stranded DNA-binding protein